MEQANLEQQIQNPDFFFVNVEIGILSAWQLSFSKKSANSRPVLSIRSNAEVSGAEKCNLS